MKLLPIGKNTWPLIKLSGKFGYLGVLMQSTDGNLVQCHECGELRAWLNTTHLRTHSINSEEYRRRNGIAAGTPLMATKWSKQRSRAARLSKKMYYKKAKLRTSNYARRKIRKVSVEERNKNGTCTAQIAFKLIAFIKKYKKLPSGKNFSLGRQLHRTLAVHVKGLRGAMKLYFGIIYGTAGHTITLAKGTSRIKYNAQHDNERGYRWMLKHLPELSFTKTKLENCLSEIALKEYNEKNKL